MEDPHISDQAGCQASSREYSYGDELVVKYDSLTGIFIHSEKSNIVKTVSHSSGSFLLCRCLLAIVCHKKWSGK